MRNIADDKVLFYYGFGELKLLAVSRLQFHVCNQKNGTVKFLHSRKKRKSKGLIA